MDQIETSDVALCFKRTGNRMAEKLSSRDIFKEPRRTARMAAADGSVVRSSRTFPRKPLQVGPSRPVPASSGVQQLVKGRFEGLYFSLLPSNDLHLLRDSLDQIRTAQTSVPVKRENFSTLLERVAEVPCARDKAQVVDVPLPELSMSISRPLGFEDSDAFIVANGLRRQAGLGGRLTDVHAFGPGAELTLPRSGSRFQTCDIVRWYPPAPPVFQPQLRAMVLPHPASPVLRVGPFIFDQWTGESLEQTLQVSGRLPTHAHSGTLRGASANKTTPGECQAANPAPYAREAR